MSKGREIQPHSGQAGGGEISKASLTSLGVKTSRVLSSLMKCFIYFGCDSRTGTFSVLIVGFSSNREPNSVYPIENISPDNSQAWLYPDYGEAIW